MKLIVACDPKGGIGYKNKLPWTKIQGDLPRFRELTTNQIVVMGHTTWDSLPVKPLPNRFNIVVSNNRFDVPEGTTIVTLLEVISMEKYSKVWLIGGAKLIESCWNFIDEIHLTRTFTKYTCDKFLDLVYLEQFFACDRIVPNEDHNYEIWRRV